ncbi:MAG: TolC family protein [Campylobacteraceae bacterium]|nr:TolC family protein [Campylobacteraceae bacterium]
MKKILLASIFVLVFLGGCHSHTQYLESNLTIPENYTFDTNKNGTNISVSWWENFNSSALNSLIEQAKLNSPDSLIAAQRLEQSRLQLENAGISHYPGLDLSAGTNINRARGDDGWGAISRSTSASLRVGYEIDFWGKIAGQKEAAQSSYLATKYGKDATMLTLYSSVAQSYFNLLATTERLKIAKENLQISEELLRIVNAKYNAGSISSLDVNQQQSSYLSQKANVENLELQLKQYKNALATLVGIVPQNYTFLGDDFWSLNIPQVEAGLPSKLLLNRPDIAMARENVNIANAVTKVANANRFPSFSLSASGGVSSAGLISFADPTSVLSLGLNAVYTLFDWGRLKNLKEIEVSRTKEVILNYNKVILGALQESEDALNSVVYQKSQALIQEEIANYTKKSLDISTMQYKHGIRDFLSLLSAQRDFFSATDSLAMQRLNHLNSLITLYKVLGGGWSKDNEL